MHLKTPCQQPLTMLRETRFHWISISFVLPSISLTRLSDPRFTGALSMLVGFLLIIPSLALMTVSPLSSKHTYGRRSCLFYFAGLLLSTFLVFVENIL
jgi:hypothetical protein